jgi:hypothetical protein
MDEVEGFQVKRKQSARGPKQSSQIQSSKEIQFSKGPNILPFKIVLVEMKKSERISCFITWLETQDLQKK